MLETSLCGKSLSTGSQAELSPWLAGPDFSLICTSCTSEIQSHAAGTWPLHGMVLLCQVYMVSPGMGYKDKVHAGENWSYRASGAGNDPIGSCQNHVSQNG